jgi:hypothetical protein
MKVCSICYLFCLIWLNFRKANVDKNLSIVGVMKIDAMKATCRHINEFTCILPTSLFQFLVNFDVKGSEYNALKH